MNQNKLNSLLSRQFLITSYILEKKTFLDLLKTEFDNTKHRIINPEFLVSSMHVYYRSIIVDLCALFAERKSEKNSFHQLYKESDFTEFLSTEAISDIEKLLKSHTDCITTVLTLRDKEYAHYDFVKNSISFNLDNLQLLNEMTTTAQKILSLCGESLSLDYQFGSINKHSLFF